MLDIMRNYQFNIKNTSHFFIFTIDFVYLRLISKTIFLTSKQYFYNMNYTQINFVFPNVSDMSQTLWNIYKQWSEMHPQAQNFIDDNSQCFLQWMIVKTRSLQLVLNGVPMFPNTLHSKRIPDVSAIASIVRGLYETAFIYRGVFANDYTPEEKEVLLCLWKILGLNNCRRFPIPEELPNKIKPNEEAEIEKCNNRIIEILKNLNIKDSVKDKISKIAETKQNRIKGYKFKKNQKGYITKIKELSFSNTSFLFGNDNYKEWYVFLSAHSHPTYYGFGEFGDMYQSGRDKYICFGLNVMACKILNLFISDLCDVISDGRLLGKKYFNSQLSILDFI